MPDFGRGFDGSARSANNSSFSSSSGRGSRVSDNDPRDTQNGGPSLTRNPFDTQRAPIGGPGGDPDPRDAGAQPEYWSDPLGGAYVEAQVTDALNRKAERERRRGRLAFARDVDKLASWSAEIDEARDDLAEDMTGLEGFFRSLFGISSSITIDHAKKSITKTNTLNILDAPILGVVLAAINPFLGATYSLVSGVATGEPLEGFARAASAFTPAGAVFGSFADGIDQKLGTNTTPYKGDVTRIALDVLEDAPDFPRIAAIDQVVDWDPLGGVRSFDLNPAGPPSVLGAARESIEQPPFRSVGRDSFGATRVASATPSPATSAFSPPAPKAGGAPQPWKTSPTIGRPLYFGVPR